MWHWDQGRLEYYQFDSLKKIAAFVCKNDFKTATKYELLHETELPFSAPETHSPWRNYSRVLKLSLLIREVNSVAVPTDVAQILAKPGVVTADEYFHFLVRATTEPSPALSGWIPINLRYPLLFSLKYLLGKVAMGNYSETSFDEIIGAYVKSSFAGDEKDTDFIGLYHDVKIRNYQQIGGNVSSNLRRQARESLLVMSQISYLTVIGGKIFVSLSQEDAHNIFNDLFPLNIQHSQDQNLEILNITSLFSGTFDEFEYEYSDSIVQEVEESGFVEGGKIKKTHLVIERNRMLRKHYFKEKNTSICDFCNMDTALSYPWCERVIDLHHLLPLSSGTHVKTTGTSFQDIRPVCPSCHRSIHKYYSIWLKEKLQKDFSDKKEALFVYNEAKERFVCR